MASLEEDHCTICYGSPGSSSGFPSRFDQDYFLAHFAPKFLFLSPTTDLPSLLSHSPLCQGCTSRLVDVIETLTEIDELQSKISRLRSEFERDLVQGFVKSGSFRDNYYELRARLVHDLNLGEKLTNSLILKAEEPEEIGQLPQDWYGQDSLESPEPEVPEPPKELITPPNLQFFTLKPLKILVQKLELPLGKITFTLEEFPHLFGSRVSKSNLTPAQFYKKYSHLSKFFSKSTKDKRGYQCTFKPETCKFKSVAATEMKIHLLEEHLGDSGEDFYRFRCSRCSFKSWSRQEHTKHIALDHKEYFQRFHCEKCDIWEKSQALLDAHNQSTHNGQNRNPAPKPPISDGKGRPFQSGDYKRTRPYIEGTLGDYRCKFDRKACTFKCSCFCQIKLHVRKAHLGETCEELKRFKCVRCGFKSLSKFQLEEHLPSKLHRGLKTPHICKTCGISLKTEALLISHTKTHSNPIPSNFHTNPKISSNESEDYLRLKPYFEGSESTGFCCVFDPGSCEYKSLRYLLIKMHIRKSHLGESCDDLYKFKCEPCNSKFIWKYEFERHLRNKFHRGLKKSHICKTCGISLKTETLLISHAKTHSNPIPSNFHTKTHPKSIPNDSQTHPKIRRNANKDYPRLRPYFEGTESTGLRCTFDPNSCQYKSRFFSLIKVHIRKYHLGETCDDLYKFKCESCNCKFMRKTNFEIHLRTKKHKGLFARVPCSFCGKSVSKSILEIHESRHNESYNSYKSTRTRTGPNRLQVCEICGVSVGNLACHRRAHFSKTTSEKLSKSKLYNCWICGKNYDYKSPYEAHLRQGHSLQKNINCGECEKTFYTEDLMKDHVEKFHRIERNFICHICGVKAKDENGLSCHISGVHRKKKFNCEICGKDLSTRNQFWRHQKICNQEKLEKRKVICPFCGVRLFGGKNGEKCLKDHLTRTKCKVNVVGKRLVLQNFKLLILPAEK